ncbi:hypothetical protein AVEN_48652-1, partial [Araneus ventricosus]
RAISKSHELFSQRNGASPENEARTSQCNQQRIERPKQYEHPEMALESVRRRGAGLARQEARSAVHEEGHNDDHLKFSSDLYLSTN